MVSVVKFLLKATFVVDLGLVFQRSRGLMSLEEHADSTEIYLTAQSEASLLKIGNISFDSWSCGNYSHYCHLLGVRK